MAYYDALVAKWPTVSGATATDKLANLNAEMATGAAIAAMIPPTDIVNAIVPADLGALTDIELRRLTLALQGSAVDVSSGTNTRAFLVALFSGKPSAATLATLVAQYDTPQVSWPRANGYPEITMADLILAGLVGSANWSYSVVAVTRSGDTVNAKVSFSEVTSGYNSIRKLSRVGLTDADIKAWAFDTVRKLATSNPQAVTIGGPNSPI